MDPKVDFPAVAWHRFGAVVNVKVTSGKLGGSMEDDTFDDVIVGPHEWRTHDVRAPRRAAAISIATPPVAKESLQTLLHICLSHDAYACMRMPS